MGKNKYSFDSYVDHCVFLKNCDLFYLCVWQNYLIYSCVDLK